MKKKFWFVPLVACASAVILASCGSSSTNASDKAVSIAQQAIDITDDYLDGNASYDYVIDTIEELRDEMDYVDDMPEDTAEEVRQHTADYSIRSALTILKSDITDDHYDGDNETYDDIVDKRNEIAEKAGLDQR